MAVPAFTSDGILPPGVHECTLDEAKAILTTTPRRQELWNNLCDYLKIIVPLKLYTCIYIDGSYITDKSDPGDIDLVVHYNPSPPPAIIPNPSILDPNYLFKTYSLHVFPYFDNLPASYNDFTEFFQYVGVKEGEVRGMLPKDKKGIIKVIL